MANRASFSDVVDRVKDALGKALLEFALNTSEEQLASGQATEIQLQLLAELDQLLTQGEVAKEVDAPTRKEVIRWRLTEASDGRPPLALVLHQRCGGAIDMGGAADAAEATILELVRDSYPAFLLPPDEMLPPPIWLTNTRVTRLLFQHPASERLQAILLDDPAFAGVFTQENDHTGRYAMTYRSTGRGGSLQLVMLPEQFLISSWREQPSGAIPSIAEFARASIDRYRLVRGAFEGKPETVRARFAFAGIKLPSPEAREFGDVVVREATEDDRSVAPDTLKEQLTGTDQSGTTTVINYDGDVVVETQMPYVVKVLQEPLGSTPSFPAELLGLNPIEALSTRLRFSLLLAVQRADRVQILPTWQSVDDPLDTGRSLGWADPRQAGSLMPAQLSVAEMESWRQWFDLLGNPDAERIALAISRLVRATGERRDPVDVLIDSVIAWENLFGTKEGEPTLRVTASLAILLEGDLKKRRKLRTKLGKIYSLRSNAVHGTSMPTQAEIPLCYEALDVGVQAIRVLLKGRVEVLRESDGASRSLNLILEG
jgi:hypothetical protein